MYKLNRHLGHEFIVEDAIGNMYICYRDDNNQIHSIDNEDDKFMVTPYRIFERNTDYIANNIHSGKTIKIIDCYWPSMSECENSICDIRERIQFKDQYGEWYKPENINISKNNNINFKFNIRKITKIIKKIFI